MFWGIPRHNFTRSRIHGENVGYRDDIILPALNNNATDRHDGTFLAVLFSALLCCSSFIMVDSQSIIV